jgi:hypothetical protein
MTTKSAPWPIIFSGLAGTLLGLALLKFGNPVVLDYLIKKPLTVTEFVYQPWPITWGYVFLAAVGVVALKVGRLETEGMRWALWLPVVWFAWQLISATQTIDVSLTRTILKHFASCVICFYLGLFVLSRVEELGTFWTGLLIGMLLVLWLGFNQHYGGLDETRRFFYEQPDWHRFPPEYLKKIASDRIFSSLVYPNALAGALLLLMPGLIIFSWQRTGAWPPVAQKTLVGLLLYCGLACLYWSGSRTGWLIALFMLTVTLYQIPVRRLIKFYLIGAVLVCGLAAFLVKHSAYFERGATSVGARFDYWRAAVQTFKSNPILGSGPGTFSVSYKRRKAPESEMALLTHNDYLEQASDSGIIGFLSYSSLIIGVLVSLYRERSLKTDVLRFAVWLGVAGWAIQGLTEFGLYIPALAWPAFMLLGWLAAAPNDIDKRASGQ